MASQLAAHDYMSRMQAAARDTNPQDSKSDKLEVLCWAIETNQSTPTLEKEFSLKIFETIGENVTERVTIAHFFLCFFSKLNLNGIAEGVGPTFSIIFTLLFFFITTLSNLFPTFGTFLSTGSDIEDVCPYAALIICCSWRRTTWPVYSPQPGTPPPTQHSRYPIVKYRI